jgi:hypothetical protein
MKNPDQSFSKVVTVLLLGAVFATISVAIQDWRYRELSSSVNRPVAPQQLN